MISLSQENIFILVDISASRGNDPVKSEAKQQVFNLILGQYSANGWIPFHIIDKEIQDLVNSTTKKSLISQNSWVCILPFGNKDTYKRFTIIQNKNNPTDFQNLFNQNYPSAFSDQYTYIQIAEAFTASLAKTYNINEYYMFIITDGLGDQDDTNSKNTYDTFEQNLLLEWNNASSSIVKNIGSLIKSKYFINLRRVTNVKNSQIPTNPNIQPPPVVGDTISQYASIKILTPPEGRKNKEAELKTDNINVNWTCTNCPPGIKFTVMISEYDGGKFRDKRSDLTATTTTFKVPDGKFRITVSAQNFTVDPKSTCIQVSTGNYAFLLFILLLAIAGGIGYKVWNDRRKKNSTKSTNVKANEIFSSNSSISPQSTNSKHY